ncbi:AMP-binding protein [Enterococcus ratti]|uniref:AMP-binding family protein n=1 Tax=Enterococcus ratti TaxID=150033 RepID=A0A1L8WT25_9ENTE|nr:AMP-binding protein [Enterococcus ratti]OJG83942.1 AMP-binding family protein [Enterococcus ratti]
MKTVTYSPLNLFSNFQDAANATPDVSFIFDQPLVAFPELGLKSTYKEALELVLTRAFQLARLGVGLGDKIIIYKSSAFDTYLLAVASSYLGAVPVMISHHFPASILEVFVNRLEDPFILFDDETAERVATISNGTKEKQLAVSHLLTQPFLSVEQKKLSNEAISYITHTSGTTGIPKLICHSAYSMGWRTKWQKTVFTKIAKKKLVAFHISPVHSRFNIGVSSLMAMGFPMMSLADARGEHVVKMLKAHPPIALETHPNNFVQWSFTARKHPEAFSSIRYYHSTFDAINNRTMETFLTASTNKRAIFLQVYGQSECGPMILKAHTLKSLKSNNARNMGVGLGELTKARITDKDGNVLPSNKDGHIQLLSKGRALTYYKEEARFEENIDGTWWDSGDYGSMDENGCLFLKDRQVDLIDTINSNLAIEDFLLDSLEFLSEVVIVRDKHHAPQPLIALAPEQEMDWERWWKQVHELPRLNPPIIRKYEDIPRTATMKVRRKQIEKELQV